MFESDAPDQEPIPHFDMGSKSLAEDGRKREQSFPLSMVRRGSFVNDRKPFVFGLNPAVELAL